VLRRAQYMLRISRCPAHHYPRNPRWRRTGSAAVTAASGGGTPLDVILAGDEAGIIAVLSELDCTFSWGHDRSKADYRPS